MVPKNDDGGEVCATSNAVVTDAPELPVWRLRINWSLANDDVGIAFPSGASGNVISTDALAPCSPRCKRGNLRLDISEKGSATAPRPNAAYLGVRCVRRL